MTGRERLLLLSTSTLHGGEYLNYANDVVANHFDGIKDIVFIPYARPSLISYDEYTKKVRSFFSKLNINVTGIHEVDDATGLLHQTSGVFIGGGNTFVLQKMLYDNRLVEPIRDRIRNGIPYMGSSAGTNLAGLSIGTTNDMPVVWPPTLEALAVVPFNINPHYLDPDPDSTHMGETRETRINEFHGYNDQPVIGLREGSWLTYSSGKLLLGGTKSARLFRKNQNPTEVMNSEDIQLLVN